MAKPRASGKKPKRAKTSSKKTTKAKSKKTEPKKPKLSQTPEAKRSRARRRDAKRAERAAQRKRESRNKRRRDEYKRRRLIEVADENPDDERAVAYAWLAELTPPGASIDLAEPSGTAAIWLAAARYDFTTPITYTDVYEILATWEADDVFAATIHPERLAQIRIVFDDPNDRRREGVAWTSNIGPWVTMLGDTIREVDPDNPESFANTYSESRIPTMYLYFGGELAQFEEVSIDGDEE